MSARHRASFAARWILVVGIAAVAATEVFRHWSARAGQEVIPGWRDVAQAGLTIDSAPSSRVTIVLFSDFECPYCAQAWRRLRQYASSHPGSATIVMHHFPLPHHRNAFDYALIAECASQRGRLGAVSDTLYVNQHGAEHPSWGRYAAVAGFPDSAALGVCMQAASTHERVQAGIDLAGRLGIRGTPTLLINDRMYTGVPSLRDLSARVALAREQDGREKP